MFGVVKIWLKAMKSLVIKIKYQCTLTASCYVWCELAKKKHSKSTCFVCYITIHNRSLFTTGVLTSIMPAIRTFQLTITVILCSSNTVKSFCNAWHVLYFHFICISSSIAPYLFRWEVIKGWGLDSYHVLVTCPICFPPGMTYSVLYVNVMLNVWELSDFVGWSLTLVQKKLLFSHFSTYIHITYINGFPGTWHFW